MFSKNSPQLPDLNNFDKITIIFKKKRKTLKQKFFFTPPKPDIKNIIKFEYKLK